MIVCQAAPECKTHATNKDAVPNSTRGYWMEIRAPQSRQRPRSSNQLNIGTLSQERIGAPQAWQCDGGATIEACAGRRTMHTFRKLPSSSPAISAVTMKMEKEKDTQPQYTQCGRIAAKMVRMDPSLKATTPEDTQRGATSLEQAFSRAVAIMAKLRAPGGCPWDREQTFDSIRRYTLEETYEVMDAIERKDWNGLKDELGDLFLQVLFYAEMAQEAGHFHLEDVMENLNDKLVRRHPHVFANRNGVENSAQVFANWEEIKKQERVARTGAKDTSLLDAIPRTLPALMEANKLGSKASSVGFDWKTAAPVFDKLDEELNELREAVLTNQNAAQEEELGDVLFTLVNLSRKLGLHSELALRGANAKFRRRFSAMEESAASNQLDKPLEGLSSDELEELWNRAKMRERKERNT